MSRVKSRDMRNLSFRNGGWWVDIQINGKRVREYAGATESKARAYRDKLRVWGRDIRAGILAHRPEGEPVTFEKFAKDYLELYARGKRSFTRDELSIDHLKVFFRGWNLRDINAESVDRYRAGRKGVSVATVNRELACLRKMLYLAVEYGKLSTYPLPTKGLLKREAEFKPRVLELEEAERLIVAARGPFLRDAIIVLLATGCRKRELLELPRRDVDFRRAELTVTAERSKNGKPRTVPLGPQALDVLKARPGKEYFFENPRTGQPVSDVKTAWATAKDEAGIKGRLRIHDLRDTFASWLLRAGVDIRTVSDLIGDSPAVALQRYCHSDERTKRAAVQSVPVIGLESRHKVHEGAEADPLSHGESVN